YTFTAGPGDVQLSADGSTDYYSAALHIVFSDASEAELADVALTATTSGAHKIASFRVPRKQPLVMRIQFPLNAGTHVKYNIHLFGAVSVSAASAPTADSEGKSAVSNSGQGQTDIASSRLGSDTTSSGNDQPKSLVNESTPIDDKWALIVGIS